MAVYIERQDSRRTSLGCGACSEPTGEVVEIVFHPYDSYRSVVRLCASCRIDLANELAMQDKR